MSSPINSSTQNNIRLLAAGAGLLLAGYAVYKEFTKFNFDDKVVLLTGGSRGLGLELSRILVSKGANVAICARSSEQLNRAKAELSALGGDVISFTTDITDNDQVKDLVTKVIDHYGRLDVLINNAGTIQVGPVESMTIEDYEKAMQTNFFGPLYAIHAVLPHFISKKEGRIVNITSIGGKIAVPHLLPYTASKFALTGLSEGLHAELKKHNITVTTVVPHLMRTGAPRNITVKGDHEAEYAWFKMSDSIPLLSQDAAVAASEIVKAIEYGDTEQTLTLTAKVATFVQGFAPGWVSSIMTLANKFLPKNTTSSEKKGYQSESKMTRSKISALTDRAAIRNNEL
jgi:NAD(P)-dependent dehydrogenase (short-subunit alcohol dehydrogenase family)